MKQEHAFIIGVLSSMVASIIIIKVFNKNETPNNSTEKDKTTIIMPIQQRGLVGSMTATALPSVQGSIAKL